MLHHALRASLPSNVPSTGPTISYIGLVDDISSQSSYTFNTTAIGGAGLIVVAVQTEASASSRPLTSVTINGTTASIVQNINQGVCVGAIVQLVVASGSTADIVVNFSSAQVRCRIAVWRITNYNSSTAVTSSNSSAASGTGLTVTLNSLTASNVVIAGYTIGTQSLPVTWTNATERYDSNIGGANTGASGADTKTTSSGSLSITTSNSSSTQPIILVAAAWY